MNSSIKIVIVLPMVLLLFGSCAPHNYKTLFYNYIIVDSLTFKQGDRLYNSHISYDEIQNLPEPVKHYAIKSGLVNSERITEMFFDYKGTVRTSGYMANMRKSFLANDHVSGINPLYDANGSSTPFIRFGSKLYNSGSIYGRILSHNLLANMPLDSVAINDICVLKYLAQMVWYPTAFINKYNAEWTKLPNDSATSSNSALLSLSENGLNASGTMFFDDLTALPTQFTGVVSQSINNSLSVSTFKITYHDFNKKEGYFVPARCVASVVTDENKMLEIEMHLKETLPVTVSKIFNSKFMINMVNESKKHYAQKDKYEKKLKKREARQQKREARRQKRAIRKDKMNVR